MRENVGLLLHEAVALMTQDMQKTDVLNASFATDFTGKTDLKRFKAPDTRGWRKEDLPLIEEDRVTEYVSKLDTHKSMGPYGM